MSYGGYATGVPYCQYQTWPFIWLETSTSVNIPMTIAGADKKTLNFQIVTETKTRTIYQQITTQVHTQKLYWQMQVVPEVLRALRQQVNVYGPPDGEIGYCTGYYGYCEANYPWIIALGGNFLYQQADIIALGEKKLYEQFEHNVATTAKRYEQFSTEIEKTKTLFSQFEQTNDIVYFGSVNLFSQFDIEASIAYHQEFRQMSYNITQLRILWEIGSDGSSSTNNYTASSNAGTGYDPVNLRSDFIERTWRTTGCNAEWFQFDSGVGYTTGIDTAAILSHNLTNNAVITVYGYGDAYDNAPSSDSDWYALTPQFTMTVQPNYENIFYVAAASAATKYRHWRVLIQDPTNTDGYIEFGRFVAGEAMVFDTRENMTMDVDYSKINYKDEQKLNGFSSLSNNRALRSKLRLSFDNLDMESNDNYTQLQRYLTYCRDTLKALVIPDPRKPYRYTVYAKLSQMPQEKHRFIDDTTSYASFELEFDEAK